MLMLNTMNPRYIRTTPLRRFLVFFFLYLRRAALAADVINIDTAISLYSIRTFVSETALSSVLARQVR